MRASLWSKKSRDKNSRGIGTSLLHSTPYMYMALFCESILRYLHGMGSKSLVYIKYLLILETNYS